MAAHCFRSITVAAALAVLGTVPTATGAQDAPGRVGGFEAAAFDSVSRIAHWLAAYQVWYVPAFQSNGLIVLGGELRYLLGPDNRVIDSTIVLDTLRGIRPDTTYTVHIDNQRNDVPTVGQTLFVLLYHPYFADIRIWNRRYQTWLLRYRNHPPAWVHAARPDGTGGGNR